MRVLVAWEHGHNLGHLARITAVTELLETTGAEIVWALPSDRGHTNASGVGVRRQFPAPRLAGRSTPRQGPTESFAHVLDSFGFTDAQALQAVVARWLDLFDQLAVDGIVIDYAPAAQLAARLARLPTVQITNGFDAPPPWCPPFGIGIRGPMLDRRNAARVQALDHAIDAAAKACGEDGDTSLEDLLVYPVRWYDCVAETDPYGPREDGTYVGPIGQPPNTVSVAWQQGPAESPKVFVYLRVEAHIAAVLKALQAEQARVILAWPGASEDAIARHRGNNILIVNRPVNLAEVLRECDTVVNYGSTTLVCQTLLAGKPQLMLPSDVEKWLVARRVAELGAGIAWHQRDPAIDLGSHVTRLMHDAALSTVAMDTGARYPDLNDRLADAAWRFCKLASVEPEQHSSLKDATTTDNLAGS